MWIGEIMAVKMRDKWLKMLLNKWVRCDDLDEARTYDYKKDGRNWNNVTYRAPVDYLETYFYLVGFNKVGRENRVYYKGYRVIRRAGVFQPIEFFTHINTMVENWQDASEVNDSKIIKELERHRLKAELKGEIKEDNRLKLTGMQI